MEQRGGSPFRRPFLVIGMLFAFLTIIGLGFFVWQVRFYYRAMKQGTDPYVEAQRAQSMTSALAAMPMNAVDASRVESGVNPKMGSFNAKIHIVEFVDYQCPFSARAASVVRAFMAKHPDDVLFTIRDFPLTSIHDAALDASLAARCVFDQGDSNRFWSFHDVLFQYQDRLSPETIRAFAGQVGVDLGAFETCIKDARTRRTVETSFNDGVAAGVRGTPTFFMNGIRVSGALDLAALEMMYSRLRSKQP